jgi:hypothetical protein
MHQVYENIFKDTPAMHVKLIVGNRNRRHAQNELIRKRPKKTLLQNTITQSKSYVSTKHINKHTLSNKATLLC